MEAAESQVAIPLRRFVTSGQSIVIEGMSANGEEYERWGEYQSRVQKVEDSSLVISSPRRRGTMVRFHDGTPVTTYLTRCGVRLCFQATVSNPPDSTPLVTCLVDISRLRKHDRREHVRAELMVPPADFSVEDDPKKCTWHLAPIVTDICLGGLGISCLQELPEGTKVRIAVDLPKVFGRIETVAAVQRIFEPVRDNTGRRRWNMGLKFISVGESDIDKIAAFVLYQQEKMKRVGSFTRFTGASPKDYSPSH